MNNKKILGVVLLIVFLAGTAFYLFYDADKPKIPPVDLPKPLSKEQIEDSKQIEKINREAKAARENNDVKGEHNAIRAMSEVLGGKVGDMLGMSLGGLVEQTMHGLVLDQHDRPLGGALVAIMFHNSGILPGRGPGEVFTDALGRFSVSGHGGGVTMRGIDHPHITKYRHAESLVDNRVQRNQYRAFGLANNTADKPIVFRVWRLDTYEDVAHKAEKHITAPPTGEPKETDNLKLTCKRGAAKGRWSVKPEDFTDWEMKLETSAPGGFIETRDAYLNEAPVSGYDVPYLAESRSLGAEDFTKRLDSGVFYYYKSGDTYGVINLAGYRPFANGKKCTVRLRLHMYNKQGTRNLAVTADREEY